MKAAEQIACSEDPVMESRGTKAMLMMPVLILGRGQHTRGGATGNRAWAAKFSAFWGGNFQSLVDQAAKCTLDPSKNNKQHFNSLLEKYSEVEEANFSKAIALTKLNQISRAASRLTSSGFSPADEKTFQDLVDLHPRRVHPYLGSSGNASSSSTSSSDTSAATPTTSLELSNETFSQAIWLSSKGTAAGITGWRYEHLKALLSKDNNHLLE